jgi:flagellar basal body-associated protein FliL
MDKRKKQNLLLLLAVVILLLGAAWQVYLMVKSGQEADNQPAIESSSQQQPDQQ